MLGVSRSTIQRRVDAKELEAVEIGGKLRYDPDELAELGGIPRPGDQNGEPVKIGVVMSQLLSATRQAQRHVEAIISPGTHGAREIQQTLLEENKALREENAKLWEELRKKDEMLTTHAREMWEIQKEQRRETQREANIRDVVDTIKRYAPNVLYHLGSTTNPAGSQELSLRGILAGFTPEQIARLADIMPPEQAALLSAVITELRKDPNLARQADQRGSDAGDAGEPPAATDN
jgi:regulator of replication initiation timing